MTDTLGSGTGIRPGGEEERMRIMVTGMSGTVGQAVAEAAVERGHVPVPWDRRAVPADDHGAIEHHLAWASYDAILHLGMGGPDWAAHMAGFADRHDRPFVFTSTAMVFDRTPDGPYRPDSPRTARDEYGRYKIECEDKVTDVSSTAAVVRIGYQIGLHGQGNNMAAHLRREAAEAGGKVRASTHWIPATSLLPDTAAALIDLVERPRPGIHHLDANAEEAWTHYEIVRAIAQAEGRAWSVTAVEDPIHDQRLIGGLPVPPLSHRLPLLRRGDHDRGVG